MRRNKPLLEGLSRVPRGYSQVNDQDQTGTFLLTRNIASTAQPSPVQNLTELTFALLLIYLPIKTCYCAEGPRPNECPGVEITDLFQGFGNLDKIQHMALSDLLFTKIDPLSIISTGLKVIIVPACAYLFPGFERQDRSEWTEFAGSLMHLEIDENGHSRGHLSQLFVKLVSPVDDSLPWDWQLRLQLPRLEILSMRRSRHAYEDMTDLLTYGSDAPSHPRCGGNTIVEYYSDLSSKEKDEVFERFGKLHLEEDTLHLRRFLDDNFTKEICKKGV